MMIVALAELGIILALVWQLNRVRDHEVRTVLDVMAANDAERAELLNRIQRPEMLPQRHDAPRPAPLAPPDAGELAKVGTISFRPPTDDEVA